MTLNPLKQDDIIELTAEKLVYTGSALSHYNGKAVFIENAVPGDIVKARVIRINKNFIRAKILEIISPSKFRTKPFCPLYNACGSCNMQNVEYNFLIEQKQNILKEFFDPKAYNGFIGVEFKPFIEADTLRGFRCKVQNPVSETKVSKRLLIGYFKENTHEVTNIKYCPIQPEIIDNIVNFIRENWKLGAYIEKKDKGLLKHIVIRYSSSSKKVLLTLVINKDPEWFDKVKPDIETFLKALIAAFPDITGVLVNFNPKRTNKITGETSKLIFGEDFIEQKLGRAEADLKKYANNGIKEYSYKISNTSFFQTNPFMAQKVFAAVKSLVSENSTILDAYGGVAAIGIYLSDKARKITLVEESESAVSDAKYNFKLNNCKNYEVFLGDAKETFKGFLNPSKSGSCAIGERGAKTFDYTILDPPRKGSDPEALNIITKLTNRAIVYVSCNPATLARDAKAIIEAGFNLKSIQGADMFPFTHHIETIALFQKRVFEKQDFEKQDFGKRHG